MPAHDASYQLVVASLLAVALAAPLTAQPQPAPDAPPLPSEATRGKATGDIAAGLLRSTDNLSPEAAAKQATLEREAITSVDAIRAAAGGAYSGFAIEHAPTFRVNVFVARDVDEQAVRSAVPVGLRQFIAIRKVALNENERRALVDEAAQGLRGRGGEFGVAYDLGNDRLDVAVDEGADLDAIRAVLPKRARAKANVRRGLKARSTFYTRPTGVAGGDATYGGWELYPISAAGNQRVCTAGITGRDSYGDNIVITAGHCVSDLGVPYTVRTVTNGRFISLPFAFMPIERSDDIAPVTVYSSGGVYPP